jgi:uncharacterized delta-60 repeat protein
VTVPINGNSAVYSGAGLALQPDGKILIGGEARDATNGPEALAAVRLNPDGSLDQTFGNGGVALAPIGVAAVGTGVAIEPNGEIALAGAAQNAQGENRFAAAVFTADGSLDKRFGSGGTAVFGPVADAWGMAVQPDGKLVLVGVAPYASPADASGHQFIAERVTTSGALDPSFGDGGVVEVPVGTSALGFGVALEADGAIVLAGPAFTTTGVAAAVRLHPDGSLDQSFGTGGIATFPDWHGVNGIVLDGQGRIVLPTTGAGAVRLNRDGSPDLAFGTGGNALAPLGTRGGANGAAIDPRTGDVVLAGAAIVDGTMVLTVIRMLGAPDGAAPSQSDSSDPQATTSTNEPDPQPTTSTNEPDAQPTTSTSKPDPQATNKPGASQRVEIKSPTAARGTGRLIAEAASAHREPHHRRSPRRKPHRHVSRHGRPGRARVR